MARFLASGHFLDGAGEEHEIALLITSLGASENQHRKLERPVDVLEDRGLVFEIVKASQRLAIHQRVEKFLGRVIGRDA